MDGVGPFDNRTPNEQLQRFVREKEEEEKTEEKNNNNNCDKGLATCDM